MVISWNIEENVKSILRHWNIFDEDYHIDFGEDCFFIVLTGKSEIFSDLIDEIKDCFNNKVILIRVDEEGNIALDCEIVEGTPALYGSNPVLYKSVC